MSLPILDFWFDFASTYSYPAAMRIGGLAAAAGVKVRFRPFLLGPIFKAQGWTTSPFNLFEAKGRHMWRDLKRICADAHLPFQPPQAFPSRKTASRPHGSLLSGCPRPGARPSVSKSFALNSAKGVP